MRMVTPEVASWFRTELSAAVNDLTVYRRRQAGSLAKRKTELANMQDRLLNAYLVGTVEEAVFKAKSNDLKAEMAKADEALAQIGRHGASPRGNGPGPLRLDPTGGGRLARFKHGHPTPDPGLRLFEPYFRRRKSLPGKEKALRRFRRRARFEE